MTPMGIYIYTRLWFMLRTQKRWRRADTVENGHLTALWGCPKAL